MNSEVSSYAVSGPEAFARMVTDQVRHLADALALDLNRLMRDPTDFANQSLVLTGEMGTVTVSATLVYTPPGQDAPT